MKKKTIRIWQGERKLLSTESFEFERILRCKRGWGYIRIMSESQRILFCRGDEIITPAGEVITVSGGLDMEIEIEFKLLRKK